MKLYEHSNFGGRLTLYPLYVDFNNSDVDMELVLLKAKTCGKFINDLTQQMENKAITMMRGKSPRSDISWRPSWIFDRNFSINFDQTWHTHIKFTSEVLFFA